MRSVRVGGWGLVAGALIGAPLPSYAGWDTFTVAKTPAGAYQVSPSVRTMLRDAMGAGWLETPVSGRSVVAGATGTVPVALKSAPMRLGWTLGETAYGKLLARSIPVLGTGLAAYELARVIRCYAAPGSSTFGGLLECDAGAAPVTTPTAGYQASGYPVRASAGQACSDAATPYLIGGRTVSVYLLPTASAPSGMCRVYQSDGSFYLQVAITYVGTTSTSCPASVDPMDGTKSVPAGEPVGVDGKCRTARYNGQWSSATESTVASKLAPVATGSLNMSQVVRDILGLGQSGEDAVRELGTPGVTGPSTVTGPTSTVTAPGGGTVTTTTVYNVTYEGDTYNYTETKSGSDGSVSTSPAPEKVEVCGLPGKPACRIDETGTPTSGNFGTAEAAVSAAQAARETALGAAAHSQGSLSWVWSLALPAASCTPFVWESRIGNLTADPCSSSGVALWRSLLAWLLAGMTGLYVWRSVSELNA